jgi:hypothetical protein
MDEQTHKHRCAVRQLIIWRKQWGLKTFREYLRKYKLPWQVIRDYEEQWAKGNRDGEKGEWK